MSGGANVLEPKKSCSFWFLGQLSFIITQTIIMDQTECLLKVVRQQTSTRTIWPFELRKSPYSTRTWHIWFDEQNGRKVTKLHSAHLPPSLDQACQDSEVDISFTKTYPNENLHCQASENSTELARVPKTLGKWMMITSTIKSTIVAPPIFSRGVNSSLQLWLESFRAWCSTPYLRMLKYRHKYRYKDRYKYRCKYKY